MENSMEVPQKIKNRTIIRSNNSEYIYSATSKYIYKGNRCTPMPIVALFTIAKIKKQPKCPPM